MAPPWREPGRRPAGALGVMDGVVSTGRIVPWAAVVMLVCLAGGAAIGSAVTTTAGAPVARLSVPAGWKPVSYGGLTLDVPGNWTVARRDKAACGMSGPGVLVGPPYAGPPVPCAFFPQRHPVFIFGGPDAVSPVGRQQSTIINGVETLLSKRTVSAGTLDNVPQYTTVEIVRFPGETVWLDISVPGRASVPSWVVVDKVVATVRPAL